MREPFSAPRLTGGGIVAGPIVCDRVCENRRFLKVKAVGDARRDHHGLLRIRSQRHDFRLAAGWRFQPKVPQSNCDRAMQEHEVIAVTEVTVYAAKYAFTRPDMLPLNKAPFYPLLAENLGHRTTIIFVRAKVMQFDTSDHHPPIISQENGPGSSWNRFRMKYLARRPRTPGTPASAGSLKQDHIR